MLMKKITKFTDTIIYEIGKSGVIKCSDKLVL